MSASLHFQGLSKRFGNRQLLDGIELTLTPGRLTLLSGPNGAGKSTLLKILAGIDRPDQGGLSSDGHVLRWRAAKTRLRSRLVYLHQQPYLYDRSVLDNLLYGLDGPRAGRRDRARHVLHDVGLDHLADRPDTAGLSGGERQRLALARALLRDPDHLLLDEPTASLDPQARALCLDLLEQLRGRGIGLLVASHDLTLIGRMADQHWHLADAQLQQRRPIDTPVSHVHDHRVLPFPVVTAGIKP